MISLFLHVCEDLQFWPWFLSRRRREHYCIQLWRPTSPIILQAIFLSTCSIRFCFVKEARWIHSHQYFGLIMGRHCWNSWSWSPLTWGRALRLSLLSTAFQNHLLLDYLALPHMQAFYLFHSFVPAHEIKKSKLFKFSILVTWQNDLPGSGRKDEIMCSSHIGKRLQRETWMIIFTHIVDKKNCETRRYVIDLFELCERNLRQQWTFHKTHWQIYFESGFHSLNIAKDFSILWLCVAEK